MLKEKIEALFDELDSKHALLTPTLFGDEETGKILRKHCGGIFTESLQKECNLQEYGPSREISVGKVRLHIHYVTTRCLRKFPDFLVDLGILNSEAKYFEYDPCPESPYIIYLDEYENKNLPPEIDRKNRKATVFKDQNPKGETISIDLHSRDGHSQTFFITPNMAPFSKNHFIIFSAPQRGRNTALKQIFHNNQTLYWIDDIFTQLNSVEYGLFFNAQGANNSMDTFHVQIINIQNSFPVFESLKRSYPNTNSGLIFTEECDWPFKGILARYTPDTRDRILPSLEEEIKLWISKDPDNTFNLVCQMNQNGYREFFFVFRQKSLGYIKGISAGTAGYEVAGRLIIEDRKEFDAFPEHIEKLEMCEKP